VLAHNNPDGPWVAAAAFQQLLGSDRADRLEILRAMVTPDSVDAWGDFSGVRDLPADAAMTTRVDSPALGVAYVRFVADPGQVLVADRPTMISPRAAATLQYRPESGRWLVHAVGHYVLPEDLPVVPSGGSLN
jgi:hypothetical protein